MEASTSSKIITTIPKGKTIEIVEKLNSGWYKVNYSGKTGYVSSKYVSMNGSNNNTNTNIYRSYIDALLYPEQNPFIEDMKRFALLQLHR